MSRAQERSGSRRRRSPFLLLAVPAIAVSAWLLHAGVENLRSGSWPKAAGTIDSVRVVRKSGSRGGFQEAAEVRYTFAIDGIVFRGERFNTRGDYLSGEEGAALVRTYHAGGPCQVAYDPSDPNRCYLDTGITWHTWGKLALGAVAGLTALFLVYSGLRR